MISVRKISYDILYDVYFNGQLLNKKINDVFSKMLLSDIDKSYIKKETFEIIENQVFIDAIIRKYSKLRIKKIDREVITILRIGVYELYFLSKVPSYATINDCVSIIKNTKLKKLSAYVNAILRNVDKNKDKDNEKDKESVEHNKKKFCYFRIMNNKSNLVIDELNSKNIIFYKYDGLLNFKWTSIYYTDNYKKITDLETFKQGYIMIQDASSQYLVDKLYNFIHQRFNNDIKILDLCSSPGGKILSLIDLLNNMKYISNGYACDLSKSKIDKINENKIRLRIDNISIDVNDATKLNKNFYKKFDVVICDVPCSGLGVINKKPDIKMKMTDDKIKNLNIIQKQILDNAKNYIKDNGIISYSTCTTTHLENEETIDWFIKNNSDFHKIFEKRIEINDENLCDGFYMCFLERLGC